MVLLVLLLLSLRRYTVVYSTVISVLERVTVSSRT